MGTAATLAGGVQHHTPQLCIIQTETYRKARGSRWTTRVDVWKKRKTRFLLPLLFLLLRLLLSLLLETTSSTFLKIRELLYLVKLQPLDGYKYCYSINNSTYTTDTLSMQFVWTLWFCCSVLFVRHLLHVCRPGRGSLPCGSSWRFFTMLFSQHGKFFLLWIEALRTEDAVHSIYC